MDNSHVGSDYFLSGNHPYGFRKGYFSLRLLLADRVEVTDSAGIQRVLQSGKLAANWQAGHLAGCSGWLAGHYEAQGERGRGKRGRNFWYFLFFRYLFKKLFNQKQLKTNSGNCPGQF